MLPPDTAGLTIKGVPILSKIAFKFWSAL